MERRKALTWLVHGGSATVALAVGVPTLIFAVAPGRTPSDVPRWAIIGPMSEFPVGTITAASLQPAGKTQSDQPLLPGVYVWRVDEQDVIVFSRSCTDLGCPITFDRGSECFFCPCHGGIFSKQGDPMAGPPDRPLYRYHTRIEAGELQVDLNSVPPMA